MKLASITAALFLCCFGCQTRSERNLRDAFNPKTDEEEKLFICVLSDELKNAKDISVRIDGRNLEVLKRIQASVLKQNVKICSYKDGSDIRGKISIGISWMFVKHGNFDSKMVPEIYRELIQGEGEFDALVENYYVEGSYFRSEICILKLVNGQWTVLKRKPLALS